MNNIDPKRIAKILGKRGGEATKKKLGKEHFKTISRKGVEARWKKHKIVWRGDFTGILSNKFFLHWFAAYINNGSNVLVQNG